MKEDYDLLGNLEGFTYQQLLNWALDECESFSLVTRKELAPPKDNEVHEKLKPHLIEETKTNEWPGTKVYGPPDHTIRFYQLNRDSIKVLSSALSVYSWISPHKPEDLAFYKTNKVLWFGSVTHEKTAYFSNPKFSKGEVQKRLIDTAVLN